MSLRINRWISCLTLLACCLLSNLALAQLDDTSDLVLSPAEMSRLSEIVNTPVDRSATFLTQSNQYREKLSAANLLGDRKSRDQFMREWLAFDTSVDARWQSIDWHWLSGRRDEAFKIAYELIETVKWAPSTMRLRTQVAYYYLQENNLKQAVTELAKAEEIMKAGFGGIPRRGDVPFWIARGELEFYLAKSEIESALGKWGQAIDSSKLAVAKSKEVFRMTNIVNREDARTMGRRIVLMAQAQLGMRQTDAGLYADAEWTFRDTMKMVKQYGFNENQLPGVYERVSDLYLASGQFNEAFNFGKKSEATFDKQGMSHLATRWWQNQQRITSALAGQNRWKELDAKWRELEVAAQKNPNLDSITGQYDLHGYSHIQNKRTDDAVQVLGQHLKNQSEVLGETHYLTAITRGLFATALAQKGSIPQARDSFEKSVAHLSSSESISGDFVETALQRKMKRFILQSYMQQLAITAATQPRDAQLLFQISDQISSSSVQQALTEAAVRAGVNVPGLSDIIRAEQDARNEIATLTTYIANQNALEDKKRNPQIVAQMRERKNELEIQRKGYKARIQKDYPEYFQLIQPKSPSHTEIAKQLKPDELFISILPMEDKTYVWAINDKAEVHFHNAALNSTEVHALVSRIRKTLDVAGLGDRAPKFDFADAHQLYKAFLGPMERRLNGKTHLIVATSGAMSQLPLAVLTRTPDAPAQAQQAAWLIKDFAISHVPTANGWLSLKKLGQQPSSTQTLLAWGDPAFDLKAAQAASGSVKAVRSVIPIRSVDASQRTVMDADAYVTYSQLPTLPETRDEVLELAKIMAADPARDVILGVNATRESVLKSSSSGALGQKQVVVFATHGLLAGDLPNLNQPALAMAGTSSPNESPLLTLEDVLSLKMNADWVVLSACNTAGADGKAEEALSGLARGFFFAGSRSLLVTHWSVESESAMQLTTHTFAAYKKNASLRRAEALRQAMLETMKSPSFTHPTYWAPYALVGEGGR
jgi:CHAT domain-containing protein